MSFVLSNSPSVSNRMLEQKFLIVKSTDNFYSDSAGNATIAIGDAVDVLLCFKVDSDAAEAIDGGGITRLDVDTDITVTAGDIVITTDTLAAGDVYMIYFT